MKVAVLTAGRSGSLSLYHACLQVRNYTSGHDTGEGALAAERARLTDGHIEIDTRFAWFLGRLAEQAGPDTHFVFLTRDTTAIAQSYNRRWQNRKGILRGYCEMILQRDKPNEDLAIAADLVETIEANIRAFLVGRPHSVIRLETWQADLPAFFETIGADVDLDAAMAAFSDRHNASRRPSRLVRARFALSRLADAIERRLKRAKSR